MHGNVFPRTLCAALIFALAAGYPAAAEDGARASKEKGQAAAKEKGGSKDGADGIAKKIGKKGGVSDWRTAYEKCRKAGIAKDECLKKFESGATPNSDWGRAWEQCRKYGIEKDLCYKKFELKRCVQGGTPKDQCGGGKPDGEGAPEDRDAADRLSERIEERAREQAGLREEIRRLEAEGNRPGANQGPLIDARRREMALQNEIGEMNAMRRTVLGTDLDETPDLEETRLQRGDTDRAVGNASALGGIFDDAGKEDAGRLDGAGSGSGPDGTPGRAPFNPGEARHSGASAPLGGAADPSAPHSNRELLMASMAGFKPSFDRHGLKVGRGPSGESEVLRKDGSPATAAEIEAVRRQVLADPRALMKRPDYFEVLPRKKFDSLKSVYETRSDIRAAAFKHVDLGGSARDFEWSASCSRLSGDCNPHAASLSYKRGEYVPPEDLGRIGDAIDRAYAGLDDEDWEWDLDDPELDLAGNKLKKSALSGSHRKGFVRSMFGAARNFVSGLFGAGGAAPGGVPAAGTASGAAGGAMGGVDASRTDPGFDPDGYTGGPGTGGGGLRTAGRAPPGTVPPPPGERKGSAWLWLVCLAAGGALLAAGFKRRA